MEKPRPKTTRGVPWGDHNETNEETSPAETRPPKPNDADPELPVDDREKGPDTGVERETYEDRAERERD
jgi:hypothetical protein